MTKHVTYLHAHTHARAMRPDGHTSPRRLCAQRDARPITNKRDKMPTSWQNCHFWLPLPAILAAFLLDQRARPRARKIFALAGATAAGTAVAAVAAVVGDLPPVWWTGSRSRLG